MRREPLIHRERTSEEAFVDSRSLRTSAAETIRGIVRERMPRGATLDDIKADLRTMGSRVHHGSISATIHNLECSQTIKQRGNETRPGRSGSKQRVMVLCEPGEGAEGIHRPSLPPTADLDHALDVLRRLWFDGIKPYTSRRERDLISSALSYLRDLNSWRRRRLLRRRQR